MVACFAPYAVVPAAGAVALPASVPLWQAALLGCGVVTGIGAVSRADVAVGASVCVIGCGGVGLQVIAGARLSGAATIIAIDRDEDKLDRARRHGATHTVDATRGDAGEQTLALTDGPVEHAFEVVGSAATIRQAWEMLRPGGTVTVVGVAARGVEVSLPALDFLSEKTITGSYYGSADVHTAIARLAKLVLDGRLDLAEVVSDLIGLQDAEAALERLRRGQGAHSVIVIDEQLAGQSR